MKSLLLIPEGRWKNNEPSYSGVNQSKSSLSGISDCIMMKVVAVFEIFFIDSFGC